MLMKRDQCDSGVEVEATKALRNLFVNKVDRVSFDRGFYSPENQEELSKIVPGVCLPKPGAKQPVVRLAIILHQFIYNRVVYKTKLTSKQGAVSSDPYANI